jgi:hypothetical protein
MAEMVELVAMATLEITQLRVLEQAVEEVLVTLAVLQLLEELVVVKVQLTLTIT